MSLWVVTKTYDVASCKTNIVSVEPYEEFILNNGRNLNLGYVIEAIDALDAWKQTREIYNERER